MKKISNYIFIFIVLCFLADTGINASMARQIDHQSPYCLSFASIGANLLESRLDSWAKIKTINNFNEMDYELIKILKMLSLPVNESDIKHLQNGGKLTTSYQSAKVNSDYMITLQTENKSTYFLLTAISRQNDLTLRNDEKILKKQFHSKSYFQYKGIIDACPNKDGRQKTLQVICKCLHAKEQDYYESNNMLSMAAYSPLLQKEYDQVVLAGKSYNFQMAIRSHSNQKQSYLYLGIPLLLNEY